MNAVTKERIGELLDRAQSPYWLQKQARRLARKGFSTQTLGFPSPAVKGPAVAPRKAQRVSHPPMPRCPAHSKEEKVEYQRQAMHWKEGKVCAVALKLRGEVVPATHCHHIYGRAGKLLMWEPGWLPTTAAGDEWIHAHQEEARLNGWLCALEEWNDDLIVK